MEKKPLIVAPWFFVALTAVFSPLGILFGIPFIMRKNVVVKKFGYSLLLAGILLSSMDAFIGLLVRSSPSEIEGWIIIWIFIHLVALVGLPIFIGIEEEEPAEREILTSTSKPQKPSQKPKIIPVDIPPQPPEESKSPEEPPFP